MRHTKQKCLVQNKTLPAIKGFQEVTLLDWDGKVASIIFLAGCNFRCGFCHARSLVIGGDGLAPIPFEDIRSFLKEKKGWVDGVIITGGEPTIDEEKLFTLTSAIKELGFLIKLDTNGTNPKALKRLIEAGMLDYISMDIKAPLHPERYKNAAGVDVEITDVIHAKDVILNSSIDYEFRTTVMPELINISDIAEIAKSIMPAKKYCIQQFMPRDLIDPSFLEVKPYPPAQLHKMAAIASEYLTYVIVRNTHNLR
ncbi:MAG: anaerobic ribonucleoside-triphosphate reductase activating protein [Candidatus Omnitrophota bacterium]